MSVPSKRTKSLLTLVGLLVALVTPGAIAQTANFIVYYEMFLPPDMEGLSTQLYKPTWDGLPRPMTVVGDGFGSRANGDFDPPYNAGLQGDGTARFIDRGATGEYGYIFGVAGWQNWSTPSTAKISMRVKVNSNTEGSSGFCFTWMACQGDANSNGLLEGTGISIALDTNQVRLVNNTGTLATSTSVDLTQWTVLTLEKNTSNQLRILLNDNTSNEIIPYTNFENLTTITAWGNSHASKKAWSTVFSMGGSNSTTTNVDYYVDWIRLHPYGIFEPQTSTIQVWNSPCKISVYPTYGVSSTVALGGSAASPISHEFHVVNTSYNNPGTINWTVAEVDGGGNPTDYNWLDLSVSGGDLTTPPMGVADTVTATLNSNVASLAGGTYTAYLKFTNDCSSPTVETRRIYLVVKDPAAYVVMEYCGDVPPTQNDSAGAGYKFQLRRWIGTTSEDSNNVAAGSVVDDTDALDGKAFRLNVTSTNSHTLYHGVTNGCTSKWGDINVLSPLGATAIARVKQVSQGSSSYDISHGIMIADCRSGSGEGNGQMDPTTFGKNDTWATLAWSGNYRLSDARRSSGFVQDALRFGINNTNGYHIVRVAVKGTNFWDRRIRMWFDEEYTPILDIANKYDQASGWYGGLMFGYEPNDLTIDVSYDYIAFTNAGAFAPGEEDAVIGHALGSSCIPPSGCNDALPMDPDNDGDVDQDDFAQFQACYSGADDYPENPANCHCFDAVENGKIDEVDLAEFVACVTGPGIPVTVETAPDCAALIVGAWEANDGTLGHLCGALLDTDDWRCTTDITPLPCFMSFGPYVRIPAGEYIARFHLAIDDIAGDDDDICVLDVADADTTEQLAVIVLTRSDFTAANEWQPIDVPFVSSASNHRTEFRIQYSGNAQLDLDKIQLLRQ